MACGRVHTVAAARSAPDGGLQRAFLRDSVTLTAVLMAALGAGVGFSLDTRAAESQVSEGARSWALAALSEPVPSPPTSSPPEPAVTGAPRQGPPESTQGPSPETQSVARPDGGVQTVAPVVPEGITPSETIAVEQVVDFPVDI